MFKARVDWWVYLVLIGMLALSLSGVCLDDNFVAGSILGVGLTLFWLVAVFGVKYAIHGNQLGIRNFFRWIWIPIDKVKTVKKEHGVAVQGAVSAVLSLGRIRITMIDRNVLKSSMPIDISPKNQDAFIAKLKEINPGITVE